MKSDGDTLRKHIEEEIQKLNAKMKVYAAHMQIMMEKSKDKKIKMPR